MPNSYAPGDKVRILADEPYATELLAGDIVTVIEAATKLEADGSELPIVIVSTSHGQRFLGLDVVEPYAAYTPADPDETVDAQLREILEGDEGLRTLFTTADTALGAEEERVSAQLMVEEYDEDDEEDDEDDEEDDEVEGESYTYTVGDGNRFSATDSDGDNLDVFYGEQRCEAHGREGAFLFQINDSQAVVIPASYAGPLISFLIDRVRFSQRPDNGTVQP